MFVGQAVDRNRRELIWNPMGLLTDIYRYGTDGRQTMQSGLLAGHRPGVSCELNTFSNDSVMET
jgi:hypothetical protein